MTEHDESRIYDAIEKVHDKVIKIEVAVGIIKSKITNGLFVTRESCAKKHGALSSGILRYLLGIISTVLAAYIISKFK